MPEKHGEPDGAGGAWSWLSEPARPTADSAVDPRRLPPSVVFAEAPTAPVPRVAEPESPEVSATAPPRRSRKRLYVLGALVVITGVAGAGFLTARLSSNPPVSPGEGRVPQRSAAPAVIAAPMDKPSPTVTPSPAPTPLATFPGMATKSAGRLIDARAGLSYERFGRPWRTAPVSPVAREGGFGEHQHVTTERSADGRTWGADIMSGLVPGPMGSTADRATAVRMLHGISNGCFPGSRGFTLLADQPLTVDGRDGWLLGARIAYEYPRIKARTSMMIVAVLDTGKKQPAVFFAAIPETHQSLWPDINRLVESLRVHKD